MDRSKSQDARNRTDLAGSGHNVETPLTIPLVDGNMRLQIARYAEWLSKQARRDARASTTQEMKDYVESAGKTVLIGKRKIDVFAPFRPKHSAFRTMTLWQTLALAGIAFAWILELLFFKQVVLVTTMAAITELYLGLILFNVVLSFGTFRRSNEEQIDDAIVHLLQDGDWPSYTILCPLYHEAQVVPQFVQAMSTLSYPSEKLQILLLTEEDDAETRAAIRALCLPPHFTIVTVPAGSPRTKPRACNYGLMQATGQYVVIYDAEDIPEPLQLKKAVLTFANHGPDLACVQAKLNFYNPYQNVLTRLFTAEYSLWFDLILPGLERLGVSIPLGGTSNHFQTHTLRALGGWDAFNVTEDCDLGLRLARYNLQTVVLNSVTYEEANSRLKNWIRQRSRWIKGYMQTYLVNMRQPLRYFHSGRLGEFLSLQLVVGAKTLVLFLNPLLLLLFIMYIFFRPLVGETYHTLFPKPLLYMSALSLIFGNFFYFYIHLIACVRRKQFRLMKWLIFIPLYWLMMSVAAAMALFQLVTKPHYWEKTIHGLHLGGIMEMRSARSAPHDPDEAWQEHNWAVMDQATTRLHAISRPTEAVDMGYINTHGDKGEWDEMDTTLLPSWQKVRKISSPVAGEAWHALADIPAVQPDPAFVAEQETQPTMLPGSLGDFLRTTMPPKTHHVVKKQRLISLDKSMPTLPLPMVGMPPTNGKHGNGDAIQDEPTISMPTVHLNGHIPFQGEYLEVTNVKDHRSITTSVTASLRAVITLPMPAFSGSERAILFSAKRATVRDPWFFITFIIACIASIATCWYSFQQQDILLYSDAYSHLSVARSVLDGSGLSIAQLGGVWLPLPHLLMLPFVWNTYLWQTGLAGSIPSMLCYLVSTLYLYLAARALTHDGRASCIGTLVFILNPNVLYLQTTPLSDLVCFATLTMASYYFLRWVQEDSPKQLIFAAASTFFATLASYDGWALFLALFVLILLIGIIKHESRIRIEGNMILFGAFGALGIILWLFWNAIIFGNALYFLHTELAAQAYQRALLAAHSLSTYHDLWQSLRYYTLDILDILGISLCLLAALSLIVFIVRRRPLAQTLAALTFLVPFIFYIVSLYTGQAILFIPQAVSAHTLQHLYNARLGAAMVAPAALFIATLIGRGYIATSINPVGASAQRSGAQNQRSEAELLGSPPDFPSIIPSHPAPMYRPRSGEPSQPSFLSRLWGILAQSLVVMAVIVQTTLLASSGIIALQDGQHGASCEPYHPITSYLAQHYDGGRILEDTNAFILNQANAGIDLKDIVSETSGELWSKALHNPSAYVDWIILRPKLPTGTPGPIVPTPDLVAQSININSPYFLAQFTLVVQEQTGLELYHRYGLPPLPTRQVPTSILDEHKECGKGGS